MGRIFFLSMTKTRDDALKILYKLRTRESDQIKTVLELYDMKIHEVENNDENKYRSDT